MEMEGYVSQSEDAQQGNQNRETITQETELRELLSQNAPITRRYQCTRNTKQNGEREKKYTEGIYPLPFVITFTNLFLFFSPPPPGLLGPISLLPPNLTKPLLFVSLRSAIICCATGDSSDDEAGEGAAPGVISASKIARDRAGVTGSRDFKFIAPAPFAFAGLLRSKFWYGAFLAVALESLAFVANESLTRSSERLPARVGIARGPDTCPFSFPAPTTYPPLPFPGTGTSAPLTALLTNFGISSSLTTDHDPELEILLFSFQPTATEDGVGVGVGYAEAVAFNAVVSETLELVELAIEGIRVPERRGMDDDVEILVFVVVRRAMFGAGAAV